MNIFGIHFCQDEARMILIAIPIIGPMIVAAWMWLKRLVKGRKEEGA